MHELAAGESGSSVSNAKARFLRAAFCSGWTSTAYYTSTTGNSAWEPLRSSFFDHEVGNAVFTIFILIWNTFARKPALKSESKRMG